jgi:tRNA-Thr(GGU) m(6)t(6)A37 methyltransferase TsaA
MSNHATDAQSDIRPGEVAVDLSDQTDFGLYAIGTIRTPWPTREACPRRGSQDGPLCTLVLDPRWHAALTGLKPGDRLQVLYWMHRARRDLVLQVPRNAPHPLGTFALRSPVRPNPIASSVVVLETTDGATLRVRGLDCMDGTPLLDIKPERPPGSAHEQGA